MCPPLRAAAASRSPTSRAGSAATTMSTALATVCELARPRHRRLNRVEEGGADSGLLELADCGNRGAARRGDGLAQLDRVHALVAELFRRPEHGLHDERRRDLSRQAEQDAGLDHRLSEQGEIRRARAGDGGHRVHRVLRYSDDATEMRE